MIKIRDLTPADITSCCDIVTLLWGKNVAEQARTELFEMHNSVQHWPPHYFVAEDDGRVVGFAGLRAAWMMTNVYEFIWINIHSDYQGKGIGALLTERRLAEVASLGGSVVMLMTQKPEFFAKFGFEKTTNIDGWELMLKRLTPLVLGQRS